MSSLLHRKENQFYRKVFRLQYLFAIPCAFRLFRSENWADVNKFVFISFAILAKYKAYPQFQKVFDSQDIH